MCPGRHFTAAVVLAIIIAMIIKDGKALTVPGRDMFRSSLGVLKPGDGCEVRI